jgi:sugar-specific transcriptional regulator TrmB
LPYLKVRQNLVATEDIIKSLESLGYTNYEAKVLYALVEGHVMTGSEVSKQAKIPRSSAYTILKKFSEQGICNEIQTSSVVQYELIDPKVVKDKIEKEIHDKYQTQISSLTDSFEKLQPVFRAKELESKKIDVELIKGFNRHRDVKFLELLKSSKQEILLMNRVEVLMFAEQDEASKQFAKKGGAIKCIYEASERIKIKTNGGAKEYNPKEFIEICEKYEKQGEQIRLVDNVLQNVAVFDRKIVFVNLFDPSIPKYDRSDIIVKNDNFANFMVDTFNVCWDKAATVEEFKKKLKL